MSLGQLLLVYSLFPVLIVTYYGIQRARRADAGWLSWLPIALYLGTVTSVVWSHLGMPHALAMGMVYVFGVSSAWLWKNWTSARAGKAAIWSGVEDQIAPAIGKR